MHRVALRKESVDRNNRPDSKKHINSVALRKESVDRNIILAEQLDRTPPVALRKESVDRNDIRITTIDSISNVALRKESVDRNLVLAWRLTACLSRSPQGERG